MSSTGDSIATPLVRGALAAALSLGTVLALVVVPALAAQVAGTRSAATALDAIIIAVNVLILGHGGGIVLSTGIIDGAVTLTPFGLLGLLLLVSTFGMRRVGRALRLVRDDGVLRARALRDAGGALGAYAVLYALGVGILAGIGRSADTAPVVTSAIVSGAMVAVLGGLMGILWSLRREATATVPGVRVLELLPSPYGEIARSALIALIGLLSVGMLMTVVMLLVSLSEQSSLFDTLDPGLVGGIVLTLVQLALLPLLAVWALVVVLGGTVGVGPATGVSLGGAETGVLPALPLLGALPEPGVFPWWAWLLLVLPAVPVAFGAVRLVRGIEDLARRDQVTAWVAYPVTVIVGVLLVAGLSTGGIGDGRLVHLGPQMGSVVLPLAGLVVIATGVVITALATPLVPWTRAQIASLREKVESAEKSERPEKPEHSEKSELTENPERADATPSSHDRADEDVAAEAADGAEEVEDADGAGPAHGDEQAGDAEGSANGDGTGDHPETAVQDEDRDVLDGEVLEADHVLEADQDPGHAAGAVPDTGPDEAASAGETDGVSRPAEN